MSNLYNTEKNELSALASSQQISAADPLKSVWVEASAGTGKTKVLSDRVLRLLLAKVNPAKILCLTYTKAAAVEMSERIAKKLSSWAVEDEAKLKKEISSLMGDNLPVKQLDEYLKFSRTLFALLLDAPGGMKIQTIHSFCQDVLKRFPLEAGISPYFEVMDDRSSKEILEEIKVSLFQEIYNQEDIHLKKYINYLTANISEYKFPEIMNMITENRSRIDILLKKYNNDISSLTHALENNLGITYNSTETDFQHDFMSQIKIDRDLIKRTAEVLAQCKKTDIQKADCLNAILANDFDVNYYKSLKYTLLTKDGTIRQTLATKDAVKIWDNVLDVLSMLAQKLLETEKKIISLQLLQSTVAILNIAKSIIARYNQYKEIYANLDYEDLIVITRRLLENKAVADWILFKLDGGIEHILIDEAQDTSPNQWAIIKALTEEFFAGDSVYESSLPRTVFVVGDRKQSIYSFQGADPKEFDKMYQYFSKKAVNFEKIRLDVSFRSTKAVMDCVNTLFEAETAKKGVILPNEHINHQPFRLGEGGKVEIYPLLKEENKPDKNVYNWCLPISRESTVSLSNQLAKLIAQNIKNMVTNGDILSSKNRPVRYGDFMFLVQTRNSFVEEFVRACKDLGVNVAGVDKMSLLEQIAVQDLISLGNFLLLPTDDLSLAEVLKSPIFGLDDNDLFTLCYNRKTTLFNTLLQNSQYSETAEKLKILLNMTGFARPFEIFNYVLVTLEGRKKFITRMGNEVEDVLDEFLNLSIAFEQKHTPSLENFISWVTSDEVIIKKEMEQGDSDTVKIMTVHGSKGLQSPIVILADAARIKNNTRKSELLWDKDDLVYFPLSASYYEDNCNRIKQQNNDSALDEYRRLLYVALTRAEDRLYVTGFTKNKDASAESWYSLLKDNLISNVELSEDDKRIVYEIPQEIPVEIPDKKAITHQLKHDFSSILTPAPIENPLAKPYAPSHDDTEDMEIVDSPLEENGNFYRRGSVIHKLLQYICTIEVAQRESVAMTFLKKNLSDFPLRELQKIVDEVLLLCKTYPNIFATNSKAEVPIIGEVDGKIISAKIDRLVVEDDKIIILDYKTNRPAARCYEDIPEIYIKQMTVYKALLQKIYPNKEVLAYLLWTNTCNMMKV